MCVLGWGGVEDRENINIFFTSDINMEAFYLPLHRWKFSDSVYFTFHIILGLRISRPGTKENDKIS